MSIHGGVENISENLVPYSGVNNVAREMVRVYQGDDNGIARLVYRKRLYLFKDGISHDTLTGGWTGTYTHQTNSGSNYSMTRLTNDGLYLSGHISATNGSSEKALYLRSLNAVDVSKYTALKCILEWYTSRDNQSSSYPIYKAWFGIFNHSYANARSNTIGSRFLASNNDFRPEKNTGYEEASLSVDLTGITSGDILYTNYVANMNSTINIRIKEIWLE